LFSTARLTAWILWCKAIKISDFFSAITEQFC
jgi:hypothetical protein